MDRGGRRFPGGRGGNVVFAVDGVLMYGRRRVSAKRSALGIFFEVDCAVVDGELHRGGVGGGPRP
jgi:hypothetical protein